MIYRLGRKSFVGNAEKSIKIGFRMKSPPAYPPICTAESTHNLDDFISMEATVGVGEVLSLTEFVKKFFRN